MIRTVDLRGRALSKAQYNLELPRATLNVAEAMVLIQPILDRVKNGTEADLIALAQEFDGIAPASIRVPQLALDEALSQLDPAIRTALELSIERVKKVHMEWIKPGHRSGNNSHNVSATVSIRENEWDAVGDWMWENRSHYNGLSVLPYSDHTYIQAPFEDCTKEKYEEMMKHLSNIDLSHVIELADNTNLQDQAACAGGACEIQ